MGTTVPPRERTEVTRPSIKDMTDRELLEEIATNQRDTADLVAQFISDMAQNPMLKMFVSKFGR